ncbi:uncharacterized protein SCODWIG_01861 [Saccharomycodes ludwigii]|uniref:Uncharacterized protein n=1 Tax=Saccharomycodes ludwigii TaxID=36035 RepID=A0A376B7L0_9ASCO|nr:uncharacterized protein SCODWIG_01861 [Saccharomycodes ludwigii]
MYHYQRFYLYNVFESEFSTDVAIAAIFLSCKQTETMKKLTDLINVFFKVTKSSSGKPISGNNSSGDASNNMNPLLADDMKKKVAALELKILEASSFDQRLFNVSIGDCIIKFSSKFNYTREEAYLSWIMGYDILKLEILLLAPSHTIALSILKICKMLVDNKNSDGSVKNTTIVEDNLESLHSDITTFKKSCNDILNYYINVYDVCELRFVNPEYKKDDFIAIKDKLKYHIDVPPDIATATQSFHVPLDTASETRYVVQRKRYNNEESKIMKKTKKLE